MVRKLVLTLIAVLGFCLFSAAQTQQISGTVVDAEGKPVAGATVMVDGTTNGTTTNAAGQFVLSAAADATLQVSFIGYDTQMVAVAGKTRLNIRMSESSTSIDDVVVVAFGTTTKEAFTGSAAVVKSEELEKRQVTNVAQALAGAIPGVQVTSSSGNPSSTPTVLVRGLSSISAGVTPLYVVDGVPYSGDLNLINTADIESLTVLKDAASTALYGARGANGVIMITTKRAKKGEAIVTLDAKWGVNARGTQLYDNIDDPAQYYEAYYQSLYNYYRSNGFSSYDSTIRANELLTSSNAGGLGYQVYTVPEGELFIGTNGKINPNATLGRKVTYNGQDYYLTPDDWIDEAYRTSLRQEYNVNISAANDRANFYASLGYLDNEGIVSSSSYTRYTARLRADYQANKWLKVGANASYSHYESNYLSDESGSTGSTNIFAFANNAAPIYPVYVRDGNGNIMYDKNGLKMYDYGDGMNAGLSRPFMTNFNALQGVQLDKNLSNGNAFTGTAFADVKLFSDLTATFNIGTNLDDVRFNSMYNPYYGQFANAGGRVTVQTQRTFEINAQQLLNYNHTFAGKHRVSAMIGHEFYNQKNYVLSGTKEQMFSIGNLELNGSIVDSQGAASYTTEYNNEGYFGRVEYEFDNRIILNGSYRRDASSRFHPDHRWGNFWSASAAWLINHESWFNVDWVDMLKLKASIGSQGNDNISNFLYVDYYNIENSGGEMSVVFTTKGNEEISWETNTNINIGADFELLRGRLGGTIEYFNRKTTDMLFYFPVAPSSGYSGYYDNVGDMRNRGFEITLHGTPIQTKNFRWDLTLNMSHYKNKVTYLAPERKSTTAQGYEGYANGSYFVGEDLSYYTWYIPKYAGVDQTTGLSMWYKDVTDAEGNVTRETTTTYSEATNYLCGTALPDLYGGFSTSFQFFGVDVSASFAYQIGGLSYDSGYASGMASPYSSSAGSNLNKDILKSWTPENPSTTIPRFQYGDNTSVSTSDRFLLDASYLNISNIQVGYTLPESFTRKFGVGKLRIYLACDNVYYWSRRQGFDPRYSYSGSTNYANYSPIRTISGGINVQF